MALFQIVYVPTSHDLAEGAVAKVSAHHWDLDESEVWFDFFSESTGLDVVLTVKADKVLSIQKLQEN